MPKGRPTNGDKLAYDWEAIQTLWEAGMPAAEIGRRHSVTAPAITYRAETRGWNAAAREAVKGALPKREPFRLAGSPKPEKPLREIIAPSEKLIMGDGQDEEETIRLWASALVRISNPNWGDLFPHAEVARALDAMSRGMPFGLAAEFVGINERTMHGYRNREPRLDSLFLRARALAADVAVRKIMGDRDWRAAAWLLERGIARAEFRQEDSGSGQEKLVIEINVSRDDRVAIDGGITMIEATATEVTDGKNLVVGLPALPEAETVPRRESPPDPVRGSSRRG